MPFFCEELCKFGREAIKIGYARVWTLEQNLGLQLHMLRRAGCKRAFREQARGSQREGPVFLRMLNQIREGDRVVVWKLARSTRDLLETTGPSDRWVLGPVSHKSGKIRHPTSAR